MNRQVRVIIGVVCLSIGAMAFCVSPTVAATDLVVPPDAIPANTYFGMAVDVDGLVAVIGAYQDDDRGYQSGSVYVYRWQAGAWTFEQKLTASDGAPVDRFGGDVAVSGDTILVGAPWKGPPYGTGAAYVFRWNGSVWSQEAKLLAFNDANPGGDIFGIQVALSGDVAMVASGWDEVNGFESGSAYIFRRVGSAWTQEQKLLAFDGAAFDEFGRVVAVDGNVAVAAAVDDDDRGANSGSAYVYRFDGAAWNFEQKLLASDGSAGYRFGWELRVDGDVIVVGATGEEAPGAVGAVYLYRWQAPMWSEEAKLTPLLGSPGCRFGGSADIDGDTILISALGESSWAGATYLFRKETAGWTQVERIVAPDGKPGDDFGVSIALAPQVGRALIGADGRDIPVSNAGAVYSIAMDAPPIANAGLDQSVHAGQTVTLDGTLSSDDNTEELLFEWFLLERPTGSMAALDDPTASVTTFLADLPGTYVVQLVVFDELNQTSAPDEVVVSSHNLAPTANAGLDLPGIVGQLVTVDGGASSDPEFDDLTFLWTLTAKPEGSAVWLPTPTSQVCTFLPDLPGSYGLELVVSDPFGPSLPDTVLVVIITGEEYAENVVVEVMIQLAALPPEAVTSVENQQSLIDFVAQVVNALQKDDAVKAETKLMKAIERIDGCALRGGPDGSGPGRDWITDCEVQLEFYDKLVSALAAL